MTINTPGGQTIGTPGVSSAKTSGSFVGNNGETGEFSATAAQQGGAIYVEISGTISSMGSAGSFDLGATADLTVDFSVPAIGDSLTPVYLDFTSVVDSGVSAVFSGQPELVLTSSILGANVGVLRGNTLAVYQPTKSDAMTMALPADDSMSGLFSASSGGTITNTGSFFASATLRLRAPTPTIGSADLDGDGDVTIADDVILRRFLAGLGPLHP